MAFTLDQLQALDNAIALGELSVEYNGKKVVYRSVGEMIAARNLMRGELIAADLLIPVQNTVSYLRRE